MFGSTPFLLGLTVCILRVSIVSAQGLELPAGLTNFEPGTGTRSLWIPFQTVSNVSASIMAVNTEANQTVYVVACATSQPDCAIAPNITLTEGPTEAEYSIMNTNGAATVDCNFNNTMTIVCNQVQRDAAGANIAKQSTTLAPSQITFQDVVVTATMNASSSTVGDEAASSSTGSATATSMTSNPAGVHTAAPWAIGGALAGGLLAVAAL